MTRVLLIKSSSLGDVIHCLPVASDLRANVPDLRLDWVVEESLQEIPGLHPAVTRTIPIRTRKWRRHPFARESQREKAEMRRALREARYDHVIDAQGLMRTAWLARCADGPLSGYDHRSVREPLASLLYQRRFPVSVTLHAVERMRRLVGQAVGYEPSAEFHYGVRVASARLPWLGLKPYIVALHGTARPDKAWDEAGWMEISARAAARGLTVVLPWGSPGEEARASRIAAAAQGARVAPPIGFAEAASLLAGAEAVIGVDTGLTHLASAVGAPVVALYLASWSEFNGVVGPGFVANLGGPGDAPSADQVWMQLERALAVGRRSLGPPKTLQINSAALGKRRRFRPSNSRAIVHGR